ncbi:MAG: ATP-dependent Clp protease ATP-binding subunit ClpX, partial [Lachnospiraceae bacterium]|nr:ATP-dependent Clp protease ATP-binding subunit ClpX [Lachnospiraceae bacterium]
MDNNFDNQDPEKEKINQIVEQSDTDSEDEYEDICYICKRPEHVAGKMIHIPNNICICSSCMQRTFDSMGDMNMDDLMKDTPFAGMSGFTMPNLSDFSPQIPNKQRLKKKKNTENKEKPVLDINS